MRPEYVVIIAVLILSLTLAVVVGHQRGRLSETVLFTFALGPIGRLLAVLFLRPLPTSHQPPAPMPPPVPTGTTVSVRLAELDRLCAEGVISPTERDEQRRRILVEL